MWIRILVVSFYAYTYLPLASLVNANKVQMSASPALVRRTQLFRDCQRTERIAVQNLLSDTILPMLHSAVAATSLRGFNRNYNRNYNRRKFFEYWGTYTDMLGGSLREDINNQFLGGVDELARTPAGRIGIYCHGEQLEEICDAHPQWILYSDRMLKEIVLCHRWWALPHYNPTNPNDRITTLMMNILTLTSRPGQVTGDDQPRRTTGIRWTEETELLLPSDRRRGVILGDPNNPLPRMYFVRALWEHEPVGPFRQTMEVLAEDGTTIERLPSTEIWPPEDTSSSP